MGIRILMALIPVLLLLLWVTSKSHCLSTQLLSSPHFIFSVFNSIVLLMAVTNHKPPNEELERVFPSFEYPHDKQGYNEYGDGTNERFHGSYACGNDRSYRSSNHHYENNNANEHGDEETDQDEDEVDKVDEEEKDEVDKDEEEEKEKDEVDEDKDEDENDIQNEADQLDQLEEENDTELVKRIEDFIAKVNKRWGEEKLRDKRLNQICFS